MKRTVSQDRMPSPLEIDVDTDKVKEEALDTVEKLSSQGYGEDFMYQIGSVAPPIYEASELIDRLEGQFVYVTVRGVGEKGVNDEMFDVEHELQNTEVFEEVTEDIALIVDDIGYELEYWHAGSVATSASSGAELIDELEGMEIQTTAKIDAGLDSQRNDKGFQPISIGWFYTAPMNREMQFGYTAFRNREFKHDEEKKYEEDDRLLEDLLGRVSGLRDDETNLHPLSDDEIKALSNVEEGMRDRGLL